MLAIGNAIGSNLAAQRWRTRAACSGQDPEWWHPVRGVSGERQKAICASCPVREPCLEYALKYAESNFGIWAGTSGRDRRRARNRGWSAAELLADLDGRP
jgi:WhiB family redox-sensing transcriptional regulator